MGAGTEHLQALVASYADAIARIETNTTIPDEELTSAVLMREQVSQILASGSSELALSVVLPLLDADARLRRKAETGFNETAVELLTNLRDAFGPGPRGWWFDIGDLATAQIERRAWLWTALAGLFLTLSVSLTADVLGRFLKNGPDFFGVLLTIVQASLAVLTGAAFTTAFWRWLDRVAQSKLLGTGPKPVLHAATAFAALAGVIGIYFALPIIAIIYNDRGENLRSKGAAAGAIAAFERAVALDPNFAVAQYNLGSTYEMIHQDDRAISAYQSAVLLDPTLAQAQNNLARLAILDGKRVNAALEVMDGLVKASKAVGAKPTMDLLYAAYKNRGWAYLTLKYPAAAANDLRHAIEANRQGASAYCLLAKAEADDATSAKDKIDEHWRNCIAFAAADASVLSTWLEEARLQLKGKP